MAWSKQRIIKQLRRLHQAGRYLSYGAASRTHQALVSAAAYHFGSFRRAIEQAGIDYATVLRRPRWTRPKIIGVIKAARRRGEALHWSAVTKRRDELGKAAFAALQGRLFGKWCRALHAAGLDADQISRYRKWDRDTIAFEFRSRYRDGEAMNSGALQQDDPGLHAAAVRHFGAYDAALRAAKLQPQQIRQRLKWDKAAVLAAIRAAAKAGKHLSDSDVRRHAPALYGAAMRWFGAFKAARAAAGIKFSRKKR